ncbi:hypothetical protein Tco_1149541, partial [Tanacetum coccineum]
MRGVSKGYTGADILLFPTILTTPESSPSRITSSPSLSPQTHPSISSQPPTPPFMQTIHDAEEPATMPHNSSQLRVQSLSNDDGSLKLNELMVLCTTLSKKVEDLKNDLKQTKLTYGAAYTKLILRVKKLEHKGRIIAEIDQKPSILLVQDKGTSWIQEDVDIKGRNSADTEILLEEPTKLVEDFGSGEKGEKDISTANILVSIASAIQKVSTAGVNTTEAVLSTVIPKVSTTAENLVYIRRSAEKRKGKAIIKEVESVQKKTKKQLEQERLSHEATIRLQEQVNKEERQRIARDAEIAKKLQEEIDTARQEQEKSDLEKALESQKQYHAQQNRSFYKVEVRKNMCMYLKNHRGYKQSHFKGMSYEDIRPIFERVWDQNQSFVPKDSKIEKERFDRDDLEKLWDLVKKKFSSTKPTIDKHKVLWVELKRLFKLDDDDDTLWKLHRYMHNPLKWRLYDTCGVHHVSTEIGHDIFMLVEKDHP